MLSDQSYVIAIFTIKTENYLVMISILSVVKKGQATPQFSTKDWKSKAHSENHSQLGQH